MGERVRGCVHVGGDRVQESGRVGREKTKEIREALVAYFTLGIAGI